MSVERSIEFEIQLPFDATDEEVELVMDHVLEAFPSAALSRVGTSTMTLILQGTSVPTSAVALFHVVLAALGPRAVQMVKFSACVLSGDDDPILIEIEPLQT